MRGREKRGTLLWVLDKTQTAMGKRLLRSWLEQPLVSSAAINRRLNCVQALYSENIQRAELSEALSHVFDMERLMTRTVYGSATPKEIYALASTCTQLPLIRELGFPAAAVRSWMRLRSRSIRWRISGTGFLQHWKRKRLPH